MSRRRTRQVKKSPSLWQRLKNWYATHPARGGVPREALGATLLIVATITLLGLLHISDGQVLNWWATAWRRLFGWMSYPLMLVAGYLGLWLIWGRLQQRLPITPSMVIGMELLLLVVLAASHLPLVVRQGPDEALLAAGEGRAGGYVGYALAVRLADSLGVVISAALLLATFLFALYLLLSLAWADIVEPAGLAIRHWGRHMSRRIIAVWRRWQVSRQGEPVAPELPEIPWWEREADPSQSRRASRGSASRQQRARPASPRPSAGHLPPLDLLNPPAPHTYGDADVQRKIQILEETLSSFGVPAEVVEVNQGPTVTQFGVDPGYVERPGPEGQVKRQRVRVARIVGLVNDLALALAASPIRIEAPVPGRSVVGIEVPNDTVSMVSLRNVLESPAFGRIKSRLAIALGEDVSGHPFAVDLALMPHLLIAGATGSGKSVCINAIICCLLCNNTPNDLKLLMVDPKMVELVGYNGIPHLMAPVVVDAEQVVGGLAWITRQMDQRYKLFNKAGVRNLEEYNRQVSRRKHSDEEPLPTLIVLIDELADLMMVAPDEVERHVCRIAQMGRATGIHLVIATQRPSVDVVTGLIKANFPARISFAVTSQTDSRVIIDQGGAEQLLGRGDMLFMAPQQPAPLRLQGCFVSDKEIDQLIDFWRNEEPSWPEQLPLPWMEDTGEEASDDLLEQAIKLAQGRDRLSTSFVQRQLRIGFPRAARLMDQLEDEGIVGPDEGGGRGREVLIGSKPGIDFSEIDDRLPGEEPY
ncbi:MAG: DNA translocase FtsK [Anaerolineae bacterium]|nr:DNA translocase FtsK [Anaerolineae bacterium]